MADEQSQNDAGKPEEEKQPDQDDLGALTGGESGDGELSNLPPLSNFESGSSGEFDSDSSLPPLGDLDLDSGSSDSASGLPPIEELSVEEPSPTGGAIKTTPPGFEVTSSGPEPVSDGGFSTPTPPGEQTPPDAEPVLGTGFQDLSADSHFPASTPDIGPGLDSDMETPMFDSAFGTSEADVTTPAETPAPTQAMETPMFATPSEMPEAGAPAFDEGAFAPESGFEPGGTPMPDFSPDTGAPEMAPGPEEAAAVPPAAPAGPRRGIGVVGILAAMFLMVIAAAVGVCLGPLAVNKLTFLGFAPNPYVDEIDLLQKDIAVKEKRIQQLVDTQPTAGEERLSQQQIDEMIKQRNDLQAAISTLQTEQAAAEGKFNALRDDLAMIEQDIEDRNEDFMDAQTKYEELVQEMSIVKARHNGLLAEVDRLTGRVGHLEDANQRRLATKAALAHDIERLEVIVKEGIPLTPEKYARDARLEAVEDLKAKASQAKWVTPALLEAYTDLYQREMEIASTKVYFFANIPVFDKFGSRHNKWAECLMLGNWGVYYRTLDGKNVGVYENVAESGPPQYGFREDLDSHAQKEIEGRIFDARVEGYEAKLKVLADKQLVRKSESDFQRTFDSL